MSAEASYIVQQRTLAVTGTYVILFILLFFFLFLRALIVLAGRTHRTSLELGPLIPPRRVLCTDDLSEGFFCRNEVASGT